MVKTTVKQLLGLFFVTAVMVGCSSNATQDETDTATPPPTPAVTTPPPVTTAPVETPRIDTVFYFDFDSSVLKPEARAALQAHANVLKGNSVSVRLEGHCDERGTREYNQALGARRANAVADYLVLQGVSRSRIETISYGEERPVDSASNESAWAKNRRVEMK